ncbi:MAG: hypothetical protein J7L77_03825, partial [Clostridiales bacterium]|nr:hypothetical protein [Clostridiales bacterium]
LCTTHDKGVTGKHNSQLGGYGQIKTLSLCFCKKYTNVVKMAEMTVYSDIQKLKKLGYQIVTK